jgi:hypothetical protein
MRENRKDRRTKGENKRWKEGGKMTKGKGMEGRLGRKQWKEVWCGIMEWEVET